MKLGSAFRSCSFVGHGSAGIEEDVATQVGLFLIFADVKAIAFTINFPVEVAYFVSGYILAVLLELDAESLVGRAVKSRAESFNHSLRQNLMIGEAREVFRI